MDMVAIQSKLRTFARERDWEKYFTPKNLSMALAIEAAELMEVFQWLTPQESLSIVETKDQMGRVEDEVADVYIYLLNLVDVLQLDLETAVLTKIEKNAIKYPVGTSGPR